MLGFRDVWAFVGQKGIQGFSPLEEVERIFKNRQIYTMVTRLKYVITYENFHMNMTLSTLFECFFYFYAHWLSWFLFELFIR